MEVRAIARHAPIAPKKARLILDEIRGKRVDEAMALLRFIPTPHARIIAKAVRSAVANAENNYNLVPRTLRVSKAWVGDGVTFKRTLPRARGRADIMRRRRSNITIVVQDEEL
ncbi:MAG: 50S ribosomal protein L22 [Chloroflexi bacterium RBG_16_64_32]|nr:MAG: 50S ribosomal protein L22 [Chloroflexi bacterium RBG_16_64_32]